MTVLVAVCEVAAHQASKAPRHGQAEPRRPGNARDMAGLLIGLEDPLLVLLGYRGPVVLDSNERRHIPAAELDTDFTAAIAHGVAEEITENLAYPRGISDRLGCFSGEGDPLANALFVEFEDLGRLGTSMRIADALLALVTSNHTTAPPLTITATTNAAISHYVWCPPR